jgi:hypothetical protein
MSWSMTTSSSTRATCWSSSTRWNIWRSKPRPSQPGNGPVRSGPAATARRHARHRPGGPRQNPQHPRRRSRPVELAELQIVYSTIKAPASGYIGRKNVEVGNRVSSGQTLLVVVEPDLWVVANFKETQLAKMQAGQPVRITIDSIPDKVFDGTVDSFSPATGQRVRAPARRQFDRQLHQDRAARAGENRLQSRFDSRL